MTVLILLSAITGLNLGLMKRNADSLDIIPLLLNSVTEFVIDYSNNNDGKTHCVRWALFRLN